MKANKQSKQQQPQVNEDLPAIVFEGRAVKAELNDIYDLLTEYAEDAKQSLMNGEEPFNVLAQLLDDIDAAKFLCTVPVGYVSKKLANALLADEDDEDDDYEYDDCDDDEDGQQLYVYAGGKLTAVEYSDDDEVDG